MGDLHILDRRLLGLTRLLIHLKCKWGSMLLAFDEWDGLMEFYRKRVFLLGPSHHFYLTGCALSRFATYSTPLGDIPLDLDVVDELRELDAFDLMRSAVDEDEHSLELHLPYIYETLPNAKLIPILVGNTSSETEAKFGQLLAPYLSDPQNVFVISSDFAHWGSRFSYTNYVSDTSSMSSIRSLRMSDRAIENPKIYESIEAIDKHTMNAIGTGSHKEFLRSLRETGNTVCGRHPIGIIMAAIEHSIQDKTIKDTRFQFVQYARSSDVVRVSDSSVSYVSAYAVIDSQ